MGKQSAMSVDKATEREVVQALRRAHEEHAAELALSLYAEHAEIHVIDHANPPDSPKVFRGKAQIAEYLANLYGPQTTHHVGAPVPLCRTGSRGREACRSTWLASSRMGRSA